MSAATPVKKPPLHSVATRVILVVFLATFLTAAVVSGLAVESTYGFLRSELDQRLPDEAHAVAARVLEVKQALAAQTERLVAELPATATPADLAGAVRETLGGPAPLAGLALLDGAAPRARSGSPALLDAVLALGDPAQGLVLAQHADGNPLLAWRSDDLLAVLSPDAYDTACEIAGLRDARTLVVEAGGRVVLGPGAGSSRDRIVLAKGGSAKAAVYPDEASQFVVAAAAPLGESGRFVLVEQPFHVAFAPVFAVLTRVFLADLAIVMLFTLLSYRLTSAIVRPIEALSEGARRISGGELGVEVPEPPGSDEIALLTRTFNDMTRELRAQRTEIHAGAEALRERNAELQRVNEVLEQLSITDGLTKLHNHRYFQDFLTRELKRVSRAGSPLSMLLIDIDDFKRLNDRLGHAAGDNLLTGLARILNDTTRATDLVARYGGEEFVVLAPNTTLDGATLIAEKIRTGVAESSFILDDSMQLTKMTVSIGVALYRGNRKTFFRAADEALYRAKAEGKNCVVSEPPEGTPELDDSGAHA
ncbi:MAG: diguanylate cyclase [Myxococcota bacterium]|nr:diguanylate cyclase [Myxococcota bacterium]